MQPELGYQVYNHTEPRQLLLDVIEKREAQLPVGSSLDYCQVNDIERKYGISKAAILIYFSMEQWCWVKKIQKIQICSVALANVPQMRAKNEKCMKPSSMGPRSLWHPVS